MRKLSSLALVIGLFLGACANAVDQGVAAFNRGEFDKAASHWNAPAQQGDPVAQHNLGILWLNGLGSTRQDEKEALAWFLMAARSENVPSMLEVAYILFNRGQKEDALSWINRAARWNDGNARALLLQMEQPVPHPDLYEYALEAEIRRLEGQQVLGQGLATLTCALAGGGRSCEGIAASSRPAGRSRSYSGSNRERRPSAYHSPATMPSTTRCPDGTVVAGDSCSLAPDGSFVGGPVNRAPDGTFVGGDPVRTPLGTYVGSRNGRITRCADGTYVGGDSCHRTSNGTFVGD